MNREPQGDEMIRAIWEKEKTANTMRLIYFMTAFAAFAAILVMLFGPEHWVESETNGIVIVAALSILAILSLGIEEIYRISARQLEDRVAAHAEMGHQVRGQSDSDGKGEMEGGDAFQQKEGDMDSPVKVGESTTPP